MRIISVSTLREFWLIHPAAAEPLKAWYHETKTASWQNPAELKQQFGSASILQNGRVVFNIAGNKFRLIVDLNFKFQIVFIKFVGTHSEYNKIDAQTVARGKSNG